jgi:hypothetical protein
VAPKDHHEFRLGGHDVQGSSDRSFGLVFAVFFALLAAYNGWHAGRLWPLFVALAALFLAAALWHPSWLAPLNRIWTRLGLLLSKIVNPIVMAAVFFLVIAPTAMIMRLRGRDPLSLRLDRAARSYWIPRDSSQAAQGSMKDQF